MAMAQAVRITGSPRALATKVGLLATLLAVGVVVIGTYVDGKSHQTSEAPAVIGVAVAVGLIVFGGLVPQAIRAAGSGAEAARRWSIGLAAAGVLSLGAFWTGAPVVLGCAAALVASVSPVATRPRPVVAIGVATAIVTIVWTILSSTVFS
jgi:hypothetical protein